MLKAKRQMLDHSGRVSVVHCEAVRDPISDEACDLLSEDPGIGSAELKAGTGGLLEKALIRENLQAAWKRVKCHKGASGVDGQRIEQSARKIRTHWPQIHQEFLVSTYRPSPVPRVMIPKPDASQRELGMPTVLDRLIQQAFLQVLQPSMGGSG